MATRVGYNIQQLISSLLRQRTSINPYYGLPSSRALRLLEIHPSSGNTNDAIECSLKAYDIEEAPEFDALSYTWGSPLNAYSTVKESDSFNRLEFLQTLATKNRHRRLVNIDSGLAFGGEFPSELTRCFPVVCNGVTMNVTANLNDALLMLSSGSLPRQRHIWIDALSIDQQNVSERNEQIRLMSEIFKAAQSVIIWLGEEDEFCDDAFTVIDRLSEIPEHKWNDVPYTGFWDPEVCFKTLGSQPLTFQNWLGFLAFIARPWFRRAWVVQELALARSATAVCGARTLSWSKISKALNFIKITRWYHHLSTEKMRYVKDVSSDPGVYAEFLKSKTKFDLTPFWLDRTRLALQNENTRLSNTLRVLIDCHREAQATDPRDKVFAFLGIADKARAPFSGKHNYIVPDYERPVKRVFADAARSLLLSHGSLEVLSHVQDASHTKIPNLPSWTPDYTVPLYPYPLRFRGKCGWSAAGSLRWKQNADLLREDLLEVQGFHIDTVSATSLLPTETSKQQADQSSLTNNSQTESAPAVAWASIVSLALTLPNIYTYSKSSNRPMSRLEALWRTLIANTYHREHPSPFFTTRHFIDYVLNLQIRHALAPWPNTLDFQAHHDLTSELTDRPRWHELFASEPEDSPFGLPIYRQRFTEVLEKIFIGTYSPIGLAQLQHEIEASSGSVRRVFRTERALLGAGPRSMRVGDEVWILAGANVPFVLRRKVGGEGSGVLEGGSRHALVGEAYVHGLMHGQDPYRHGQPLTTTVIE